MKRGKLPPWHKPIYTQGDMPMFYHPQIKQLYSCTLAADEQLFDRILLLPYDTLVHDLSTVIWDGILRYEHFSKGDGREENKDFVLLACLLLAELEAEEGMQPIVNFLMRMDEVVDFYLGAFCGTVFWEVLHDCGYYRLDLLHDGMCSEYVNSLGQAVISESVLQMSLHYPENRKQYLNWYRDVLIHFIEQDNDNLILDKEMIGTVLDNIREAGFHELEMPVMHLFDRGLVRHFDPGFKKTMQSFFRQENKRDLSRREDFHDLKTRRMLFDGHLPMILEFIDQLSDEKLSLQERKGGQVIRLDRRVAQENQNGGTYSRSGQKTGRNDPCPCGSGTKYKKCCWKITSMIRSL